MTPGDAPAPVVPPPGVPRRSVLTRGRSALRLARRWLWSREAMHVNTLERATWDMSRTPPPDPACRWDRLEDFDRYTGSIPHYSRARLKAEAAQRLAEGEHCDTWVEDGVRVHYGWMQLGAATMHMTEIGFTVPVPPNTALIYDVYTEPGHRRRGFHQRAVGERIRVAFELGVDRLMGAVLVVNTPSQTSTEKGGYRPVARVVRVRRFGFTWAWAEPA